MGTFLSRSSFHQQSVIFDVFFFLKLFPLDLTFAILSFNIKKSYYISPFSSNSLIHSIHSSSQSQSQSHSLIPQPALALCGVHCGRVQCGGAGRPRRPRGDRSTRRVHGEREQAHRAVLPLEGEGNLRREIHRVSQGRG